jgi:protein-S-isoprenylcysteine O-methyltransferase Ste14
VLILVRAVVYATAFVGLLLVFVPAQLVTWFDVPRPASTGAPQIAGVVISAVGGALAIWCVLTFVVAGKGTPAPFDPPRQLVVTGPYRYMRNPMYFGAGLAISGAALYYQSIQLLAYATAFCCSSISSWCSTRNRGSSGRSATTTRATAGRSGAGDCRRAAIAARTENFELRTSN